MLTGVLKCAMQPSSEKLSWETVQGLLGIVIPQTKWRPTQRCITSPGNSHNLASFQQMQLYWNYVGEMYDEAGKLPLMSMLLVDTLHVMGGSSIYPDPPSVTPQGSYGEQWL